MPKLIEYLESFNRKERVFLVGAALGKPAFQLAPEFREQLGSKFGLDVPAGSFAAMDYHLDWIYASLYLAQLGGDDSSLHINKPPMVHGTQEDIDFLAAFEDAGITHLLLIEAKAYTGWDIEQLRSKSTRLQQIFGADGRKYPNVVPHFNIMSPKCPEQLENEIKNWPDEETAFFWRLLSSKPAEEPVASTQTLATKSFQQQIEELKDTAEHPTLERATVGLFAAAQIESLGLVSVTLDYVQRLPPTDRETLLSNRFNLTIYEQLVELAAGPTVPQTWGEWLERLELLPTGQAIDFAKAAADEWSVREHIQSDADVRALVEAINNVSPAARSLLFDTLPQLVTWVQNDPEWPKGMLRPLYWSLYEQLTLLLADGWRPEAAAAVRNLLDGILELGPNVEDYSRLLNDLGDVIPKEAGTGDFDVLIDVAEMTVAHASPDPDVRQRLWGRIYSSLAPISPRLGRAQRALANAIAQVFGMHELLFPEPKAAEQVEEANPFVGKTIAIYTLAESVGTRISSILESLYPGVNVQLAHDKVGSPRLEELARNAHVFVVCWQSAAHAATGVIDKLRPRAAKTLYPAGKGSSSILREITGLASAGGA